MCLQDPKMKLSHFCSQACIDKAEKMGPMLLEVPIGHDTFRSGKQVISYEHIWIILYPQLPTNSRRLGGTQRSVRLSAVSTRYAPRLHHSPLINPISKLLN